MENTRIRVSFDYDDTLSDENVQDYARDLMKRGIEVYVVTYRFKEGINDDLFKTTDSLSIPRHNIFFTDMKSKSPYLKTLGVVWHLDDMSEVLVDVGRTKATTPVDVLRHDWKGKCEYVIKKAYEDNSYK